MNNVENSFSRFFNIKFERKGPLWQSRFKHVRILSNKLLLHISRYIHLNPTSSGLVKNPEDWLFSSYKNFVTEPILLKKELTEISINNLQRYKQFVESNKEYQRKLKEIRKYKID